MKQLASLKRTLIYVVFGGLCAHHFLRLALLAAVQVSLLSKYQVVNDE